MYGGLARAADLCRRFLEATREVIRCAGRGVVDALRVDLVCACARRSARVRQGLVDAAILNVALVFGVDALFRHVIAPHASWAMGSCGGLPPTGAYIAGRLLASTTTLLWTLPMHVASVGLNAQWAGEVADGARSYVLSGRSDDAVQTRRRGLHERIADALYWHTGFAGLGVFCALVDLVPGGVLVGFPSLAWLYGACCFDARWSRAGLAPSQRIARCASRWLYLAGFGAPLSLVAHMVPARYVVAYAATSALYPIVPLFFPSLFIFLFCFGSFLDCLLGRLFSSRLTAAAPCSLSSAPCMRGRARRACGRRCRSPASSTRCSCGLSCAFWRPGLGRSCSRRRPPAPL